MINRPFFTVVIPTLNSGRTIGKTLESIRNQDYDQAKLEIIVIDGGSTDDTLEVAKKNGCRILHNPMVQQEHAKWMGLREACGRVVVFIDSDESFGSPITLAKRERVICGFEGYRFLLSGGHRKLPGASSINDYQNLFADPFTYFMTGTSGEAGLFIECWRKRYQVVEETGDFAGFTIPQQKVQPTVDFGAGGTIDIDFVRRELSEELKSPLVVPQLFYLIIQLSPKVAILKDDFVFHYSADNLKTYLRKLDWRVKGNIHYRDVVAVGFANREPYQPLWVSYKKYLFIPYALTVVLPLLQGIVKAVRKRKPIALVHPFLCFYVAVDIVWQYLLKAAGRRPTLKTYGSNSQDLDLG